MHYLLAAIRLPVQQLKSSGNPGLSARRVIRARFPCLLGLDSPASALFDADGAGSRGAAIAAHIAINCGTQPWLYWVSLIFLGRKVDYLGSQRLVDRHH
jgi:hypothetical protein